MFFLSPARKTPRRDSYAPIILYRSRLFERDRLPRPVLLTKQAFLWPVIQGCTWPEIAEIKTAWDEW